MVVRSMPASRSLKLRVPSTNSSGSPAPKPSTSMRKDAGSKYTAKVARQVGGKAGGRGMWAGFRVEFAGVLL